MYRGPWRFVPVLIEEEIGDLKYLREVKENMLIFT